MNNLNILNDAPFSQEEQQRFAASAVDEILSGIHNVLAVDMQLKAMADTIEQIRRNDKVKKNVIEEALKYGKSFDLFNAKVTVLCRTSNDYTGCGDPVYNDLLNQKETITAQIKAREAMLATGVNPETGETYQPPKTSTSEFLTYKFK
jgi:hypothetical protein